jgi:hypothetical protein
MSTFQEKYLKYKTKYLVLLNNLKNQNNVQNGGDIDIMNISNLSDTPVFQQGGNNNIFNVSNLSDTPIQDGGKKIELSESSNEDSNLSTISSKHESESSGGASRKFDKHLFKNNDSSSSKSISSSSEFSLSNSSESLLSALKDSDSDS